MAESILSYDHEDEDYIDIELSSHSNLFCHSKSSPPHPLEFEFQMFSSSSERDTTTSPADELFYKGQLLPLHLPPRLQMVEKLLHHSNSYHNKSDITIDEFFSTPLTTNTNTTPIANTPFESCNISPSDSCQVSRELSPDEYFLEYSTVSNNFIGENPKKSWTEKLKLIKQSSIGSKLKASRTYLKSLFSKSGCSDESTAATPRKFDDESFPKAKDCVNKYARVPKMKTPFGQIQRERNQMSMRSFNKEKIAEDGHGHHRRSFSVTSSLAAAQARLHNVREERDQFYEANDHIVAHLKTKEDELSRSIGSCKIEADVLNTWINFLEDTWVLQCSYTEIKEKEVNDELERHEGYFLKLVIELLTAYEIELSPCIDRIGKYVENLKSLSEGSEKTSDANDEGSKVLNPRKNLEEEYLDYEAKVQIITTFSVVENMKEQFYAQQGKLSWKDDPRVKELFDNIEKLREEFESIERPNLEMETPPQEEHTPASKTPQESQPHPIMQATETPEAEKNEHPQSPTVRTERLLDPEAELAKLESEFGKVNREYSAEEIGEWEFDELEKELRSSDAATSK
ncbi:unnamed protein product [Ilex paraguariensis]|uniref:Uncharacterized protein n=1 Tax=Ilex paraguariensis TaxID=185542 RepID=A0ABC8U471_9AQUA